MNLACPEDNYQGTNRGGSATVLPEATVDAGLARWLLSFSLTKILSPKTFFDLKSNYFEGIYYLDPTTGPRCLLPL